MRRSFIVLLLSELSGSDIISDTVVYCDEGSESVLCGVVDVMSGVELSDDVLSEPHPLKTGTKAKASAAINKVTAYLFIFILRATVE